MSPRTSKRQPKPSAAALQKAREDEEKEARTAARRERERQAKARKLAVNSQAPVAATAAAIATKNKKRLLARPPAKNQPTMKQRRTLPRRKPVVLQDSSDSDSDDDEEDDDSSIEEKKSNSKKEEQKATTSLATSSPSSTDSPAQGTDAQLPLQQDSQSTVRDRSRGCSWKELQEINPQLVFQLFLQVGNKNKLGFGSHNILLTNNERAHNDEGHPKAFPLDIHFNDQKFQVHIMSAIEDCLEANVPRLELHPFNNQACIYRRSEQLTQSYYSEFTEEITDYNIQGITCNEDWLKTLQTVGRLGFDNEGNIDHFWIPLLCHVRPTKPSTKNSSNARQSQENTEPQLTLGQSTPEGAGEIDLDSILMFGYDKTIRFVIQGPTYESEDAPGKFVMKSKGNDYYELSPPFKLDELKSLKGHGDIPDDTRHKIGTIEPLIKATASLLPSYKDESGKTILGVHSQFYIQPMYTSLDVVPVNETISFWDLVRKRWNLMKPNERSENNPIEIRCSLAAKSSKDDPYIIPEFFYEEEDDLSNDDSDFGDTERPLRKLCIVPEKISKPELFSQEEMIRRRQQEKPPVINNNKSSASRRSDQTTTPKQMEEYLWKCHADVQSPLYHAFTREHYIAMKDYLIRFREDGRSIPDNFPCIDGDPETWLQFSEIPEHIRTKPYCGKLIERGKYPPINSEIMSSYQCFEKTPEQIEEDKIKQRQANLESIVQSFAGMVGGVARGGTNGVTSQPQSFVFRFILSDSCYIGDQRPKMADILVPFDDERTLQQLYDLDEIKQNVRNGFSGSIARAVNNEMKELVLVYKNYIDLTRSYQQFSIGSLNQYKAKDIISSIPRDSNGLIAGACFPITIYIEAIDKEEGAFI